MLHWLIQHASSATIEGLREAQVPNKREFQFISPSDSWLLFEELSQQKCKIKDDTSFIRPSRGGNVVIKGDGGKLTLICESGRDENVLFWVIPKTVCRHLKFMRSRIELGSGKTCVFPPIRNKTGVAVSFAAHSKDTKIALMDNTTKATEVWDGTNERSTNVVGPFFLDASVDDGDRAVVELTSENEARPKPKKRPHGTKYLAIGGVSSIGVLVVCTGAILWNRRDDEDQKDTEV